MPAIGLAIGDVVDQVDHARQRAEDHERRQRVEDRRQVREALPEQQRQEHDEVLDPLRRTQRDEQSADHGAAARLGAGMVSGIEGRAISSAAEGNDRGASGPATFIL